MKKINDGFYEIEPELYAELKEGQWFITDEKSDDIAGPFVHLDSVQVLVNRATEMATADGERWIQSYVERIADGATSTLPRSLTMVANRTRTAEPTVTLEDMADLVTLREAAEHLPVTRQALEARKARGTLPVSPVITGRTVELYSLKALKEAYRS